VDQFCPSDPADQKKMRIHADPDPHHWEDSVTIPNIIFLFSAHEKNGIQTWDSTQADGQCILKYYVCWLLEKE